MPELKKLSLDDYLSVSDKTVINKIRLVSSRLQGEYIAMVNSTPSGGGVAEILNTLVLLLNSLGLRVGWRILKGSDNFFQVTKEFHNALQGSTITLSARKKLLYEQTCYNNAIITHLQKHDLVVVHDPQPLALIQWYKKRMPWIWRCHIDLSQPNAALLDYLRPLIEQYDAMVVSSPSYRQDSLAVKQIQIMPSIDPLSVKNAPLAKTARQKVLRRQRVSLNKPIIAQISRFDKWKDPLGVIETYKLVKKKFDCRLVLMGNLALDDPEGPEIYRQVIKQTKDDKDITVLLNSPDNDRTVNALQSVAKVILQKSLKEGFALTVSEAMWKGTPVVGSRVGGIPLQVRDGQTGYLVSSPSQAAAATLKLLTNEKRRATLGRQAKDYVRKNFLITRQVLDYLEMFDYFLNRNHRFNTDISYRR
ncbi:MAG: glycosyltransferase [bacterium]|nr:glycosyltransferase [bacterium]